jgi:hypothetical protein
MVIWTEAGWRFVGQNYTVVPVKPVDEVEQGQPVPY